MERISSPAQLKTLIAENKKRFARVETNCLSLPNSFIPQIEKGRLYFQMYADGMGLFQDEDGFYDLLYFWDSTAPFADFHQEKPVAVVEYSSRGRRDAYILHVASELQKAGFCVLKKNLQYALELQSNGDGLCEKYQSGLARLSADGLRIEHCATVEMEKQVRALWEAALNPSDFESRHLRFMEDSSQTVACVLNGNREAVGVYLWENSGRDSAVGWHLAVREDHRHRGIASALLSHAAIKLYQGGGVNRLYTWIADTNLASIRAHVPLGFLTTGNTSTQFLLK